MHRALNAIALTGVLLLVGCVRTVTRPELEQIVNEEINAGLVVSLPVATEYDYIGTRAGYDYYHLRGVHGGRYYRVARGAGGVQTPMPLTTDRAFWRPMPLPGQTAAHFFDPRLGIDLPEGEVLVAPLPSDPESAPEPRTDELEPTLDITPAAPGEIVK